MQNICPWKNVDYRKATKFNFNPLCLRGTNPRMGFRRDCFVLFCLSHFLVTCVTKTHAKLSSLSWHAAHEYHALSYVSLLNQPKCTLSKHLLFFARIITRRRASGPYTEKSSCQHDGSDSTEPCSRHAYPKKSKFALLTR